MPHSRKSRSILILLLGLLAINGWAFLQWSSSRSQAIEAEERLHDVRSMAQRVEFLKQAPKRAEATSRTDASMARLVEEAAKESSLPSDRIAIIDPGNARRIGDTPYQEQPTTVELRSVTMRQIAQFALAITQRDPGILIPAMFIRTPAGDSGENGENEVWNVELTLTSRIYNPKSSPMK